MKRVISLTLVILIFLMNTIVLADEKNGNELYFSGEEIITLSNYYISQYLFDFDEKIDFKLDNDFVKLYDTSGNHFAYLIKFSSRSNGSTGYLTLGALKKGLSFYEIRESDPVIDNITSTAIEENENIVFIPPMQYYIKSKNEDETLIKTVDDLNGLRTIPIGELKDNDIYDKLVSPEFEKINNNILNEVKSRSSTYPVYLSKWTKGQFLPTYDSGGTYYGGDQGWLANGSNGCGPTSAANILAYLADKNKSKYGDLYTKKDFKKSLYTDHMEEVYAYMEPVNPFYGLLSLTNYCEYLMDFAYEKGVVLLPHKLTAPFKTEQQTIDFIKAGLSKDTPVACLNLAIPKTYKYAWHWMTITAFKDLGQYQNQIVVTSWKSQITINFYTYYLSTSGCGGGYAYFE